MSSLLGALHRKAAGRQVRCCIKDSLTGATRFEALERQETSIGRCRGFWLHRFRSLLFLFAHCKIRGSHFPDPLHRLHDDHDNAITASGLASMKTERIIVSNHKSGPWKQSGNFRRLQDAAMEYFSSANANDELYLSMYPYIVVGLWRGQIPSDMDTPEHHDFVWRMRPDLEILQPNERIYEGWSMVSTRPQVRAHDKVRLVYCGISSGSFTNMAGAPLPGGSHLVDFIAERAPTPSGANGDAREAETHDAPKPPSSAAPLSKLVALYSYQADLRERVARDTNTLVAKILADRLSRAFAVVYLHQAQQHPQAFPSTVDDDVAHAAWHATEQSYMQGSLVVDILAEMRNEDMLMEGGVSAVDPHRRS